MGSPDDAGHVNPPLQARSRATLARIGQAVAELLAQKPFDDITIQEVVERSGVSVGSFYARFSGKRALLRWFDEHYFAESRATMRDLFQPARWADASLEDLLEALVTEYVSFVRRHEHVLRPIVLENRARPDSSLAQASRPLNQDAYRGVVDLVLRKRDEIAHDEPEIAVELGLAAVFAASHELILFRRSGLQPVDLDDDRLAAELARGFVAYLTTPGRA